MISDIKRMALLGAAGMMTGGLLYGQWIISGGWDMPQFAAAAGLIGTAGVLIEELYTLRLKKLAAGMPDIWMAVLYCCLGAITVLIAYYYAYFFLPVNIEGTRSMRVSDVLTLGAFIRSRLMTLEILWGILGALAASFIPFAAGKMKYSKR